MRANNILVVAASSLLLIVGPQDVLAQGDEARVVKPGDLVRVHFNQRRRNHMRGELVAVGSDSLTLLRGDEMRHLALEGSARSR
jgi:hypothetical protein